MPTTRGPSLALTGRSSLHSAIQTQITTTTKTAFVKRATQLLLPTSLNLGLPAVLAPAVNAILARGNNPEEAIGGYAIALAIMMLVSLPQMRIQQMTLVFLEDRVSLAYLKRFTAATAVIVAGIAAIVTLTPISDLVLAQIFSLQGKLATEAQAALVAFLPLPALAVVRPHLYGCAIRSGHTSHVWAGTAIGLGTVVLIALTLQTSNVIEGAAAGASAVTIGALAEVILLTWLTAPTLRQELPTSQTTQPPIGYRPLVRFFLPLLVAGLLATVTPAVIHAALARTPTPETSIAAVSIALSVSHLLTIILWGLQPTVLALLGKGYKPFWIQCFANAIGLLAMLATMMVAFIPPVTQFVLQGVLGTEGDLFTSAELGLRLFAPLPIILAQEQIYSSALMRVRLTQRILRVNIMRLTSLIGFVVIGLKIEIAGVALGMGVMTLTLIVEAAATYIYGRNVLDALNTTWMASRPRGLCS